LTDLDASGTESEGPRGIETDQKNATGGQWYGGDFSRFRARAKEVSGGFAQLKTWRDADTRVSLVAVGPNYNFLWETTDTVSLLKWIDIQGKASGRADFFDIELVREGQGVHTIYRVLNVVNHKTAATGTSYDQTLIFPVTSPTVTFSITDTAAAGTITVTAQNFAGATVVSATGPTVNGRTSVPLVLTGSTIYKIRCQVTIGTALSNAALRVDGSTTYIAG
jgi:hypothetical protein